MALHAALVPSFQQMWLVLFWYRMVIDKQIGNMFKSRYLLGEVPNTFEVFFELTCRV